MNQMTELQEQDYLEWVKQAELPPMTRTQFVFAQWLFTNREHINKIGNLDTIFTSVRQYVKSNPPKK